VTLRLTIADTALTVVSSATNLCDEPFVEISAEGAMSQYRWNTGETSQSIMVNNPGVYSVTVSEADCSVSKGVTIEPCMVDIILPNTITPGNHDNLNDWFELSPVFQSQMSDFSIRIFDRWGNVVFASRDKGFRWGGEVNGNLIPNSMYNYVIQYKDLYGEQFVLKGNLLVL
ncbi:MAG: gliding motility-associated C-terminal domain-containing protein, partial [Bacteroidales bacterium]|nr:gliding motility-associated C-terminal domain-containing protein [Bacteroidales bacterium]